MLALPQRKPESYYKKRDKLEKELSIIVDNLKTPSSILGGDDQMTTIQAFCNKIHDVDLACELLYFGQERLYYKGEKNEQNRQNFKADILGSTKAKPSADIVIPDWFIRGANDKKLDGIDVSNLLRKLLNEFYKNKQNFVINQIAKNINDEKRRHYCWTAINMLCKSGGVERLGKNLEIDAIVYSVANKLSQSPRPYIDQIYRQFKTDWFDVPTCTKKVTKASGQSISHKEIFAVYYKYPDLFEIDWDKKTQKPAEAKFRLIKKPEKTKRSIKK